MMSVMEKKESHNPQKSKFFSSRSPFNVILISFNRLRWDYLGVYGYPKKVSPIMDEFTTRGVLPEDAATKCGWTLPQHMTLLTGLFLQHGLIFVRKKCHLSPRFPTLSEIFQENGYLTFGFANQNSYGGGWQYGFYRGMHAYSTAFPRNNMMEIAARHIIEYFRLAGSKPFFMYIHSNDTHEPFAASEPFGSRWGSSYQNRYEGEITYVDYYLGIILKELERNKLSQRTLIVVTSDHGTEFREHGFLEKKVNLYEEILRVPLIMSLPDVLPEGKEIPGLAQTADIPATILDICSLPFPKEIDGNSLLPRILNRKDTVPELIFAHTFHENNWNYEHFAARSSRYKFIRTIRLASPKKTEESPFKKGLLRELYGNQTERFERLAQIAQIKERIFRELYDLQTDPAEKNKIIEKKPSLAEELEGKLNYWIRDCRYTPPKSRKTSGKR